MNHKQLTVSWTNTAQQDLRRIIEYISLDSITKAKDIYQAIRTQAEELRQLPARGRIVPELKFYGVLLYRELIIAPWRVIYRTESDQVWILAVIDSRRNVADVLLDRFIG